MLTKLNELRDAIHANAVSKGFYEEIHPDEHYLALVVEEIGEAITADRNGNRALEEGYKKRLSTSLICKGLDPKIPKERGLEVAYKEFIKGSLEEELADIVIRLLDFAGHKGIDLTISYVDAIMIGQRASSFIEVFEDLPISLFIIASEQLQMLGVSKNNLAKKERIAYIISELDFLAEEIGIDLLYHVRQKMAYNSTRPYKHGKKY